MATYPPGTVAVIFVAQRTNEDGEGYETAAETMGALASRQPGYLGVDSVRDAGGLGITVSYWIDEEAAIAWRNNEEHTATRNRGRGKWYSHYDLHVAAVTRSYDWVKP